jgi:uncharacterized protein YggU (UPF0235/DUF167 family)
MRAEKIVKKSDDLFMVSVTEPAERGLANRRVLAIVRKLYPGKSVRLVSGHHKPTKIIEIG